MSDSQPLYARAKTAGEVHGFDRSPTYLSGDRLKQTALITYADTYSMPVA